ncbi:MAG: hypothetical protein AVO33_01825 [delta proteobacterium ML8_F1]|nr:MAG: hypothetical protein AVO33_01825 [delta proteobacterium ML8_F1]
MQNQETLGKTISHITRDLHRFFRYHAMDSDIGWGQLRILIILYHHDGITQDALGKELDLDKTTVTRTLQKMVAKELVFKKPNPQDHRSHLICLTQKARDLSKSIHQTKKKANQQLAKGLTPEELTTLCALLSKVKANAQEMIQEEIHE